ncbi:MAG: hypothetical protein JWP66_780 [Naasia sp.]|nr:hypothetical protein [Naasia sp.]
MTDEKPAPTSDTPVEPVPSADPAAVGETAVVPTVGEPIPAGPDDEVVVAHAPVDAIAAADGPAYRGTTAPGEAGTPRTSAAPEDAADAGPAAVAAPVPARRATHQGSSGLPDGAGSVQPEVTAHPHAERAPVVAVAQERGGPAPVADAAEESHSDSDSREAELRAATERTRVLPVPDRSAERTERLQTAGGVPAPAATAARSAPVEAVAPRTIYVESPTPPRPNGNRGFGVGMALLSTLVFALVWAGVAALIIVLGVPERFGQSFTTFLSSWAFWLPVLGYALGMVLLALLIGRGGWAWWLIGGFLVAVLVYFSYLGGAVLTVAQQITPNEVESFLRGIALTPLSLGAAVVAREVSIWTGLAIAARGKRVKAKNVEARASFDREQAERRAPA